MQPQWHSLKKTDNAKEKYRIGTENTTTMTYNVEDKVEATYHGTFLVPRQWLEWMAASFCLLVGMFIESMISTSTMELYWQNSHKNCSRQSL